MSGKYYLPKDIEDLLEKTEKPHEETEKPLIPGRLQASKNLGLILDKYPPKTAIGVGEGKSSWLKALMSSKHIDAELAKHVYQRWQQASEAMRAQSFIATTEWRMAVGLGGKTVIETDLTLHHLYGIPFIPGSALKGLTRAYVTGEVQKSKKIENDDPIVQRVFGTQKDAGGVIFFDAMPIGDKIEIDLDIMNAHYPEYYGKKKPPANDQKPNPVTFLTVTNTTFMFALAPRRPKDTEDVKLAVTWLQKALQEYGVGGKTSAGYGYFKIENSSSKATTKIETWQRPNIPHHTTGQEIQNCTVLQPTEVMQQLFPEAGAFLHFREWPSTLIFIVIEEKITDVQNWKPKGTKNCIFLREERRGDSLVLICKPRPPKDKKQQKEK